MSLLGRAVLTGYQTVPHGTAVVFAETEDERERTHPLLWCGSIAMSLVHHLAAGDGTSPIGGTWPLGSLNPRDSNMPGFTCNQDRMAGQPRGRSNPPAWFQ